VAEVLRLHPEFSLEVDRKQGLEMGMNPFKKINNSLAIGLKKGYVLSNQLSLAL